MPLPEAQRREALQILGIDCYLPRVQLPGAPESALYPPATAQPAAPLAPDVSSAPAAVPEPVNEVANRQSATPARATRTQAAVEQPAEKAVPAPPSPAPEKAATDSRKVREEIKLQLVCIRAGGDLAILAAMPHLGPTQLSARHQALLANLLRGCKLAPGDLAIEEKAFRWPMVTGLHVDNSKRAAASALKAYLHQKMTDWETCKLLVLGEAVVGRLFESDDDTPALALSADWQIAWTRSLDELLQRPALKKDAWLHIRHQFS